ncbi:MAG: hypothetical protein AAF694_20025 [Bacteroidota bacterium]
MAQELMLPEEASESHIRVPGTGVFLIPPPNFEPSENFKGFQSPADQTSMIMVMEIPGPYQEVSAGFREEHLGPRGMELKGREEVQLYGYSGMLIEVTQEANGMLFSKHILVYGDSSQTTMINGVFLADSSWTGKNIQKSILSTFIDNTLMEDPRSTLDFSLEESGTGFQFVTVVGNGMLFNRDGKIPTESEDQANLIADKSFQKLEIADNKLYCISRLKKYPDEYSVSVDREIAEVEIDGLNGYTLYAHRTDDSPEHAYQVILFPEDGGYFLFFGTYTSGPNQTQTEEELKQLVFSFARKQ